MAGGVLTLLVNATLTPLLPQDVPFATTAASPLFLARQSLSAVAAALLLFGSMGLYLRQAERRSLFGGIAFFMACLGSALLLAWEWVDVFVLRSLALRAPEALTTLDAAKGMTPYVLGALIPLSLFSIGWIALAAWTFRGRLLPRAAAALVIAGFFITPILAGAISPIWGSAIGNAVLGSGWAWLGWGVLRSR